MPLKGNLLEPISADRPTGVPIRANPIYTEIKEARREEDDLNQGEWKHERKVADYGLVLKLGQKVLSEQSKDLEVATWIVEALLNREGFVGLAEGLELLAGLLETFWDKLYPRFDEDEFDPIDLASKLDFIGNKLNTAIKMQPVTASGISWFDYDLAKKIPTKDDAYNSDDKAKVRSAAEKDQKLLPEEFEREYEASPKSYYADTFKTLEAVFAALNRLDEVCEKHFDALDPDDRPSFYSIKQNLEEFNQTIRIFLAQKRELEPDPVEEPEPVAEEEEESEPEAEAAEEAQPEEEAEERKPAKKTKASGGALAPDPVDEADAFLRVVNSARYLRASNPADPVPFLLLRALRWGELRRNGNGYLDVRQFDPPQTEVRQQLKMASLDGDWAAVLEAAEGAAGQPCGRAWIDLQRYAVTALKNLGYSAPADALVTELRGILEDFPGIVSQTMMDDTPTANGETQAWLNVLFPPPAPPPEPEPEPEPAYQASAVRSEAQEETAPGEPDLFEQAQHMAARGNVSGAISLLSGTIATERSGRGRFLRRVQLAQICLSVGRPGMARNILEEVVKEVESRKLEEWESSETLAQPLALYFQALGDSEEDQQRKRELYSKICRLDPSQALAFAPMD